MPDLDLRKIQWGELPFLDLPQAGGVNDGDAMVLSVDRAAAVPEADGRKPYAVASPLELSRTTDFWPFFVSFSKLPS